MQQQMDPHIFMNTTFHARLEMSKGTAARSTQQNDALEHAYAACFTNVWIWSLCKPLAILFDALLITLISLI